MLDNKKIKESEERVKKYIKEGIIVSRQTPKNVDFFLINSQNSLTTSKLLFDVSINPELQKKTGYLKFDGSLWVINSSYYSMFYMARAILEFYGIRIKSDLSTHLITLDALIYYFYINGKLQKKIIDSYFESKEEAKELLGKEKAENLIFSYYHEKQKRAKFTYETGELAMKSKAQTSLKRAINFTTEVRKLLIKLK